MNDALAYSVRVRTTCPDPFAGLRSHDYIRARGLAPVIGFGGLPKHQDNCPCQPCTQARLLPAVLQICAAHDRRQHQTSDHPARRWNDVHDESLHELLAGEGDH